VEGGLVENVYRLQVMNLAEQPRRFVLAVTGLQGIRIANEQIVEVPAAATQSVSVRVRVEPDAGKRGANPIHFEVRAVNHDEVFVREKASFLLP
jgi:polyferredoxin